MIDSPSAIGVKSANLRLDGTRLELLSRDGPVGRDLRFALWGGQQHSLHHPTVFLGSYLVGPRGLAALSAGAPLYRDDRPVLEYTSRDIPPEETREIPIVELLRGHLDPVADATDLALGPAERAAIREIRDENLGNLAARALLRRANVLANSLSSGEMMALLREAVAQNSDSVAANLRLAQALMQIGRLEEARRHYSHALELQPQNQSAKAGLEQVQRRLERDEGFRPGQLGPRQ